MSGHREEAGRCTAEAAEYGRETPALLAIYHILAAHLERTDPPPAAEPAVSWMACDCGLFGRCDYHERTRAKGCTCNGPFASAHCVIPTHRNEAERNPGLDPSRLE